MAVTTGNGTWNDSVGDPGPVRAVRCVVESPGGWPPAGLRISAAVFHQGRNMPALDDDAFLLGGGADSSDALWAILVRRAGAAHEAV